MGVDVRHRGGPVGAHGGALERVVGRNAGFYANKLVY